MAGDYNLQQQIDNIRETRPDLADAYQKADEILNQALESFNLNAFEDAVQEMDIYNASGTIPPALLFKIAGLVASQGHPLNVAFGQERKDGVTAAKTERRRMTHALILQAQIDSIEQRCQDIEEQIAENEQEITRLKAENKAIEQEIIVVEAAQTALISTLTEPAQDKYELIDANNQRANAIYAQLKPETQTALLEYEQAGGEIITVVGEAGFRHVVFEDETNSSYFIKVEGQHIPVTDPSEITRIEFQKQNGETFGNHLSLEQLEDFYIKQDTFFEALKQDRPELASELTSLFAQKELIEAEIVTLDRKYLDIKEEVDANNLRLRELGANHHTNTAEINRLEAENEQLSIELETLIAEKNQRIEQQQQLLENDYGDLLERLKEAREELEVAEQELVVVEAEKTEIDISATDILDNIRGYGDRHDFLEEQYGGRMSQIAGGLLNERTARAFAAVNRWSPVVKAWKDPIQDDDGNTVYRDNETGKLYRLEIEDGKALRDENGDVIRHYYDDADAMNFYEQAWGEDAKFFGNETPYGLDPENTFDQTRDAMLETKNLRENVVQTQDNAAQAVQDSRETVAQKETEVKSAEQAVTDAGLSPSDTSTLTPSDSEPTPEADPESEVDAEASTGFFAEWPITSIFAR